MLVGVHDVRRALARPVPLGSSRMPSPVQALVEVVRALDGHDVSAEHIAERISEMNDYTRIHIVSQVWRRRVSARGPFGSRVHGEEE